MKLDDLRKRLRESGSAANPDPNQLTAERFLKATERAEDLIDWESDESRTLAFDWKAPDGTKWRIESTFEINQLGNPHISMRLLEGSAHHSHAQWSSHGDDEALDEVLRTMEDWEDFSTRQRETSLRFLHKFFPYVPAISLPIDNMIVVLSTFALHWKHYNEAY